MSPTLAGPRQGTTGSGPVVIAPGDPNGVGPETLMRALVAINGQLPPTVIVGAPGILEPILRRAGGERLLAAVTILTPAAAPGPVGRGWDRRHVPYLEESLELALAAAREGDGVLVTGPVDKQLFVSLGFSAAGHTEFLARRCGVAEPLMLFDCGDLKVAVMTRHVPLGQVTALVTRERFGRSLSLAVDYLGRLADCRGAAESRSVAVAGLDPHCGEWGATSDIDLRVRQWVEEAAAAGLPVTGPRSADTLFLPANLGAYSAILCWYHDQGMIPVKLLAFDRAVNVTLGLPIVRLSPAHGPAYDLAGSGQASATSALAALRLAAEVVCERAFASRAES